MAAMHEMVVVLQSAHGVNRGRVNIALTGACGMRPDQARLHPRAVPAHHRQHTAPHA